MLNIYFLFAEILFILGMKSAPKAFSTIGTGILLLVSRQGVNKANRGERLSASFHYISLVIAKKGLNGTTNRPPYRPHWA